MPEPPRACELRNDSNLEVVCQPGNDGGLQQHFVLEAVGATSMYFNNLDSTRSTHEILDNEISTMNDQVRANFFTVFLRCSEGNAKVGVVELSSFCPTKALTFDVVTFCELYIASTSPWLSQSCTIPTRAIHHRLIDATAFPSRILLFQQFIIRLT